METLLAILSALLSKTAVYLAGFIAVCVLVWVTNKWTGVEQEAIEADWCAQLAGMSLAGIRKALESLPPDFPPTATAFKALGMIREESQPPPMLPPPDPAGARRVADAAASVGVSMESAQEWMARLQRDVLAGTANRSRREHYKIAVKNGYYGEVVQESAA